MYYNPQRITTKVLTVSTPSAKHHRHKTLEALNESRFILNLIHSLIDMVKQGIDINSSGFVEVEETRECSSQERLMDLDPDYSLILMNYCVRVFLSIVASHNTAQCISSHLSISREDHVYVNEHMGFYSEASEEQGNSIKIGGPLIEIGHEVQSIKETSNRNHSRGQLKGHNRNTSLSSATSSLDDGHVPTTGGANALEGLRTLSVCSHYRSDVFEELTPTSSATGPQYRETKSSTRLPEISRLGGLTLWRR
jgi:hypothetical protein